MDYGFVKPTVHQLFNQHLPQLVPQQQIKSMEEKLLAIGEHIDANDTASTNIQKNMKHTREQTEKVAALLNRKVDDIRNVRALQTRTEESLHNLKREVQLLQQNASELSAISQRVVPSDSTTPPSGIIHLPSGFFVQLHNELVDRANHVGQRLLELETSAAFLQRERSAARNADSAQLAQLEGVVKMQYTQYRKLSVAIARLQARLQGAQDNLSRFPKMGPPVYRYM
jgi:chromosome segregation ATPase